MHRAVLATTRANRRRCREPRRHIRLDLHQPTFLRATSLAHCEC